MKTQEFELTREEVLIIETEEGAVVLSICDIDEEKNEIWFGIDGPKDLKIELGNRTLESLGTPQCKGLPRVWLLFSLLLSHKVRREYFMPCFNEFVEDYLFAKKTVRKRSEKRWLACAFTFRTLGMVGACLRIQYCGFVAKLIRVATLFPFLKGKD